MTYLSMPGNTYFYAAEPGLIELKVSLSSGEADLFLQFLSEGSREPASYTNVAVSDNDKLEQVMRISAHQEPAFIRIEDPNINVSITITKYDNEPT